MDAFFDFLKSNVEWVFSGVGVVLVGFVLKLLFGRFLGGEPSQSQSVGNGSIGIQAGRDANTNKE